MKLLIPWILTFLQKGFGKLNLFKGTVDKISIDSQFEEAFRV